MFVKVQRETVSKIHIVILSEAKNLIFYHFLKDEILQPLQSLALE
jgi:hypothetical protein